MSNLDQKTIENVNELLYKIALVYANHYPTPSLYECTTKIKRAKNIILPDGIALGILTLHKGLEYMLTYTELIAPQPVRYAVLLNDNISAISKTINLPPTIDVNKNYVINLYTENERLVVEIAELDDELRNYVIDNVCYRPSPFR